MRKSNSVGSVDGAHAGPPAPAGRFSFLCNPQAGTFLGRTGKSWALIVLFYIIYYACLAAFFGGMLAVFLYNVIVVDRPHLTGQQSLLKLNPGMGFRPMPEPENTIIKFTAGRNDTFFKYTTNLEALYRSYKPIDAPDQRESCDIGAANPDPTKVCRFNWDEQLPNCRPGGAFGYMDGKPCVILKLNRVFGWVPDPKDPSVPHPTVRCYGENAADAENLGTLIYQPAANGTDAPAGYFSNVYFPYLKQRSYQAPLVAVIFENLPPNTLVMVECRLENLSGSYYSRMDREAMVRFDIFVEK